MRIRCHRCHVSGTEQPEEITVLRVRYGTSGEPEFRLRCDKCGHEWPSDSLACWDIPGARRAPVEYADTQLPRVYGR